MSRVKVEAAVWDATDSHVPILVQGATVQIVQPGTVTQIPVYAASSGGSPLTQPFVTDARGVVTQTMYIDSGQEFERLASWTHSPPGGAPVTLTAREYGAAVSPLVESRSVLVPASATSGTAVQAAITALGVAGGEIILLPGTHTWDTIPAIPPAITGRLAIRCAPGAKILHTTGARRCFDWGKIADYDVFQNVEIGPLLVDAANLGGLHHVVIGPWQNGAWQRKINGDNIHVHDIEILNAVVGTDSNTDFRIGVHIGAAASTASDNLCTWTNCSVRRVKSSGCLQLVAIHGVPVAAETTAKVFHDNIVVEDIDHPLPTTPTTTNTGSHVMAGTKGTGGSIVIRRVRGTNSPDVGVEWDGWQDASLSDILVEDAYNADFYHVNFSLPASPEAQVSRLSRCVARRRNLNDHGQGFLVTTANGNRPGSIHFGEGCEYHRMSTSAGFTVQNEGVDILGSRRVTGEVHAVLEYPDYAGGSDVNPSAIRVRSDNTSNRLLALFDAVVKATGSRSGAGLINFRPLLVREGLIRFDINLSSEVNITGGGNAVMIEADIGATSGAATISGRLKVDVVPGSRGNTPIGVQYESGSFNTVPTSEELVLHDSNMAGLATTSTEVSFAGASTLANRVRYERNTWRNFPQAYRAVTANTTLDGRADLIDTTDTTAARTHTLPAANAVPKGRRMMFKDGSGGAGTNNITVQRAGADTIEGGTSKVISTNYGGFTLYSDGVSKWAVAA